MIFRTELECSNNRKKIEYPHKIFTIGSCFSLEIAQKLIDRKFPVCHNPFGALFHPLSIENAIMRIYSGSEYTPLEIYKYEELYISWDHHSSFDSTFPEGILNSINQQIQKGQNFLREADWVIITLGSAYVYLLKEYNLFVANCHKVPSNYFTKKLLTTKEIINSLKNIVEMLRDIGKNDLQIIFTLSPVRHLKDGIANNQLSKALLLTSIYEVIDLYENCIYFPSYELMMDDLRDYRFYKPDLIHPTDQAIQYIWEKFTQSYFSESCTQLMKKVENINTMLQHRALHPETLKHKKTLYHMLHEIENISTQLPPNVYSKEYEDIKLKIDSI